MAIAVYHGRKATTQQQQKKNCSGREHITEACDHLYEKVTIHCNLKTWSPTESSEEIYMENLYNYDTSRASIMLYIGNTLKNFEE